MPPVDAPPLEVAKVLIAAYQAGDGSTVLKLCGGTLRLHPGDLGRITNIRWGHPFADPTHMTGFAPGAFDVPFTADTSGSPDETIPAGHNWDWSFIFERRTPGSRWLAVTQGQG